MSWRNLSPCSSRTFPSYPERNPSENAKNATSMTCGNQAFYNFQSNLTPPLHSRPPTIILKACQAFLSKSDICSSNSLDADILFICGPKNVPSLTFASGMLGNKCLIWRKARLVGFKALANCLAS